MQAKSATTATIDSPSGAARPAAIAYRGLSEASAAAVLDARHFVVADDGRNVLFVYTWGVADPVVAGIDLVAYLDTETGKDGLPKKSDIEAGARSGDRIYWMASHSRDAKGRREASRQRFFATPVVGPDAWLAIPDVPPYRDLLKDLIADPLMHAVAEASARKIAPEEEGGLNIEGLAATPDETLLVGFRNPLVDAHAIVVPFDNPADVVAGRARARFEAPLLLDLGGRGIRSIDRVGDGYLIVAGAVGGGKARGPGSDFAVYAWSGAPGDRPLPWVDAPLGQIGPEVLIHVPGTESILLLSDDGDLYKTSAVPHAERSFRTCVLDLSTAVFG